ncbi:S-layer homology domain-containing protein [Butyricicoccus pullicaecorum]|nr:S-layer homology domain-containing protein [Butyricicoccus pullicaecorum]
MKKRLLSILLTACLLMGLLPTTALASSVTNVTYYNWNSSTKQPEAKSCSSATLVEDSTDKVMWNDGWYVAQGSVTITSGVTITGDVHLILADNCALTIGGGIRGEGNLTIYGQSEGTGRLIVNGGMYGISVSSLTINSGTVTVDSKEVSGDGASYVICANNIAINGGHVTVTAPGGRALSTKPTLPTTYWWRTNAGELFTKDEGEAKECIYESTYVEIWNTVPTDAVLTYGIGLDVSGTHTFDSADVGYGAQTPKTVTVRNTGTGATGPLTVELSGENADAFTVSKSSIDSIAPSDSDSIGADRFTVVPNTGLPAGTYTATVTVDGDLVDAQSFTVRFTVNAPAVVVPENYVFNIAAGTIRILDGDAAGTIKVAYGDGKTTPDFAPSQEITVTGSFVISSATKYIGKSLKVETGLPVKIRIKNLTINNNETFIIPNIGAYEAMVLLGSEKTGKADVILTLEGTNYLRGGRDCGGIEVGEGHTLTIRGNGALTAQGYSSPYDYRVSSGAGIGGHAASNCGTVTIESGTVTAIGGDSAAGIGGGFAQGSVGGNGGNINISGGTVTATGGEDAAGIGGGSNQVGKPGHGLGGNVTITGGTVIATAGSDEADAIGGGRGLGGETKGTGTLTVNGDAWVGWTGTTSTNKSFIRGVVLGVVYGNVTLTKDRTLTSGFGVLSIRSGASLTIPKGKTLTMEDGNTDIHVKGTLINYGTLALNDASSVIDLKDGTLTNYGTLTGSGSITPEEKKLTYAAPPSAPEIASVSADSITLQSIPGAEYSKDGGATWQTSPTFSGLTTQTAYTFYARYAGNNFYHTSAPSADGTTQYTAENAPTVGKGFHIDYTRQRITLNAGYEASWANFGALVANDTFIPEFYLGKNLYIRKAASGNTPASPAMANRIPDRPAAPTDVAYEIDYVNEKLSYDDNTYRVYRIIFGEEQTVISGKTFYPGETYYVCTRAVEEKSFESKPLDLSIPDRPAAPDSSAYVINFRSETISFDDSIYEVTEYNKTRPKTILNGDTVTPGKSLRIYKKAVAGKSFKSYPLIVNLPNRFDVSSDGETSSTTTTTKNPDGSTTTTVTDKIAGTVTETTRNTDGSTTIVETKKNGTVTETTKMADGTTGTVVTAKNGTITEVKSSISSSAAKEAFQNHETVTLPVEVPAAGSTKNAPAVEITVPKGTGLVRVEIPVEDVTPGTVAVIVKADGTEEIVSTSMVTENGIALTLTGSTTVKIIDNTKSFSDVLVSNVFYNEVCSISAREIMVGRTDEKFDLRSNLTLNQLSNVAARINGAVDVKDYNGGIAWGEANGLQTGNESATRGDMLEALYVAAGSPDVTDTSSLSRFHDALAIPDDMKPVAAWAVQNDILKGTVDGKANLSANVTRGQACALAGRTLNTLG